MKRILRWALVAGLALAGLVVNLSYAPTQSRGEAVLSDFVNLGADPGAGGILRLDFLVSNAARAARREKRLDHVHPALLAAHAAGAGLSPDEMRARVIDPTVTDPFDITGLAPPARDELEEVKAGGWRVLILPGPEAWLLYYTQEAWFYAPRGTRADLEALAKAHPELAALSRIQALDFNG